MKLKILKLKYHQKRIIFFIYSNVYCRFDYIDYYGKFKNCSVVETNKSYNSSNPRWYTIIYSEFPTNTDNIQIHLIVDPITKPIYEIGICNVNITELNRMFKITKNPINNITKVTNNGSVYLLHFRMLLQLELILHLFLDHLLWKNHLLKNLKN